MKHTVGEIKAGTDVWMIFQELHETKPLQVTILEDNVSTEYMMPRKNIQVHEREGIAKYMQAFIPLKHFAFCNEFCYDTEEEAQKVLDEMNVELGKRNEEIRKEVHNWAVSHIVENNMVFTNESERDTFINGFISCAMDMRHNPFFANYVINKH
jgi:hypothetical protein